MVLVPSLGIGVLLAWLMVSRPNRAAASLSAAVVLALAVAAVAMVHGSSLVTMMATIAGGALAACAIIRLDAVATPGAANAAGIGAAGTALGLAVVGLVDSFNSGFAQVAPATHHPNATAAVSLALLAGSGLAWHGGAAARPIAVLGMASAILLLLLTGSRGGLLGVVATVMALGLIAVARVLLLPRRPSVADRGVLVAMLIILATFQAVLVAPERLAPWLPLWAEAGVTTTPSTELATQRDASVFDRFRMLLEPLGESGGRLASWKLAREMIAHRPLLGYGFDAVERVFAPGAESELSNPLVHPHHGALTLLLEGGALLLVATLTLLAMVAWRLGRAAIRGDVSAGLALAVLVGLVVTEMLDSVLRFGQIGGHALIVLLLATATRARSAPTADAD